MCVCININIVLFSLHRLCFFQIAFFYTILSALITCLIVWVCAHNKVEKLIN